MPSLDSRLFPLSLRVLVCGLTLIAAAGSGCSRNTVPAAPPVAQPPSSLSSPSSVKKSPDQQAPSFSAQGTGPTEKVAYLAAKQRLLLAFMNDESLSVFDPFNQQLAEAIHQREFDLWSTSSGKNGVDVRIGLHPGRIPAAFSRLEASILKVELPDVPPALRASVRKWREVHLLHQLCVRKRELLPGVECTAPHMLAAQADLLVLLANLKLKPIYNGGLPKDQGGFLRPLRIIATLGSKGSQQALAGLPLLLGINGTTERLTLKTNSKGELSYLTPKDVETDSLFTVTVDLPTLVGTAPPSAKFEPLLVRGRQTNLSRSAVVALALDGPTPITLSFVKQTFRADADQRVSLLQNEANSLRRSTENDWKEQLPLLADKYAGRLDAVIFVDAESEFASRMGTHRVWFEARGTLTAVSAWTGKILHRVTASVTESGVGERRAEDAARKALGQALASKLNRVVADKRSAPPQPSIAPSKPIASGTAGP